MKKEDIIELNKKQKEFYNTKKRNFVTEMWSKIRGGLLGKIRKSIGIQQEAYKLHQSWFGDLSQKRVLDLGCYSGNNLSLYLAQNSKEYIGLDLSDVAIEKLNQKLKDIPTANAIAADFLSDADFPDKDFDLIYAYGVLHHFQDVDMLINRLNQKLAPNGEIISYDPLETSLPIKIVRAAYRPFQSDKDWEWPFTKKTYYKFDKAFDITERRGVLGKSKWFFLLNFVPMNEEKRQAIGRRWHKEDWETSQTCDSSMFSCMHLTMKMQKR
ncbi:class I SAM-dependent methyltransferase [Flavobacterium suncheonense]|uniref:Methyltransferase n=1 Tax=Flavobacterium suncheonense GH29-5 = DSM 17707 TaxID=1121899 RepID=A0A0A2MAX3_9FLAO|nr:class I SAM-dependent methyltransferase [Flavobacterium suncheonense]KGO89419.1 methyltransferase [Flavobacterium suncheonense GH29-5 = DSM 17707]